MTSDLFPDCRQDSPRLAWMKRHGIKVTLPLIMGLEHVCVQHKPSGKVRYGGPSGGDEDEVLARLASELGIPLWNEEQFAKEHK